MKLRNARDFATLQDELVTRVARDRLEPFLELAWPILLPGTPFQSNWHIGLTCEYLEAVTMGQISRLVINMPPRYGKSVMTSVIWPVWEWIRHPSRRWLFVSHSETLAGFHSLDRRRLILDPWFRDRFPTVRLAADQRAKMEFHNTRRGTMLATSMGGAITGKGGDRLVIDDPHSPEQAESDLQRLHALERFRTTFSTRLDDKKNGAIVVVMQRLHTMDMSGLCLELGFEHLCLEALPTKRTTLVFPRSDKSVVREVEEPLWPAREDRGALDSIRTILGSFAWEGQYQQRPVPRTGGYFLREWWAFYDELPADTKVRILQSWDLTFKDGDGSDFVVGIVAAQIGAMVYVLDRYRAKLGFVDTVRAIKGMVERYPATSVILIEDAANGSAVIDTLKRDFPGVLGVSPEGGKQARANAVQAQVEAKQVLLPSPTTRAGDPRIDRAWVEDFIAILAAFPKGPHDDDVDALTQLLVWVKKNLHIEPCSAVRLPDPPFRPRLCVFRTSFSPRTDLTRRRLSDWIWDRQEEDDRTESEVGTG